MNGMRISAQIWTMNRSTVASNLSKRNSGPEKMLLGGIVVKKKEHIATNDVHQSSLRNENCHRRSGVFISAPRVSGILRTWLSGGILSLIGWTHLKVLVNKSSEPRCAIKVDGIIECSKVF